MKKSKTNPHCPVPGCKTKQPNKDDPIVKGLIAEFGPPEKLTSWVLSAMAELRQSIMADLGDGRIFAWISRLRQPEELYVRTLYLLFVAGELERHHVLSGDTPNGLSGLYAKVNTKVFDGRGSLLEERPGLLYDSFRAMDTLHDGAHVSFRAFVTCIGMIRNPEYLGMGFKKNTSST